MEHWCRQSSIRLNDRRNLKFQKFWKLLRVLGPGKLKYIWERKHYYTKKCFTFPYFLLRIVGKIGKTKSRKLWENRLTVQSVGRSVGPWSLWPGSWDLGRFKKNEKSKISILFFSVFANGPLLNWGQLVRDVFKILNAFGVLSAKIDVFLTSLASATVDFRWLVSVILQRRRSHTDTSQHLSCLKIFLLPIWSPSSTFKCANTQRQRWSTKICAWKKDLPSSTKCSVRKLLWF